jgi:hypothetical protein
VLGFCVPGWLVVGGEKKESGLEFDSSVTCENNACGAVANHTKSVDKAQQQMGGAARYFYFVRGKSRKI